MILSQMHVTNYRALRDVTVPLSKFGCIIGENNAGKSSVLTALSLFLTGNPLAKSEFFDPKDDIRIAVDLEEISPDDLNRLEDTHRARLTPYVTYGKLTLVRVYNGEGRGKLRQVMRVPLDKRFDEESWKARVVGKRGDDLRSAFLDVFPELSS